MAKRVAEEYITKDKGSTPNYNDPNTSGLATMSTPAQIAARTLRTPKSRLGPRGGSAARASFNSVSAPNPFGQSQQPTFAPPSSSFTFGPPESQMSFGQNTAQASTPSVFGQSTSQSAPSSFSFGQPSQTNNGPTFSFGSNNTETTQPAPTASSTFSFGQPSQQLSQTNGSAFGFGSNSNTATTQSAPTFSFGQTTQTSGSTFSFGSNNNNKTAQTAPSVFAFGQPAQANGTTSSFGSNNNNEATQTAPPTFSFGQPTQVNGTTPSFGTNTSTATMQSAPSTFSFAQPAQANETTFSFGAKTDTSQTAPSPSPFGQKPQAEGPLSGLNFGSHSQPAPTPSTFGQSAPIEDTTMFSPPRKDDKPNFFQLQSPAPAADTAPVPTKPSFQFLPPIERETASSPAPAQEPPAPAPVKSLFQSLPPVERREIASFPAPTQEPPAPAPVKSLFQSVPPVERRESASPPAPAQAPTQAPAPVQFEKVKIRSNGPSEPLVTDDHTKWSEHDKKYRLRSLNKELVRRLGLYDPGSQEFDNVIIFYYQAREKLGLMWPSGARNTKRKADDEDPAADRSFPAKKAKASETSGGNSNPTLSIFSSASTSTFGAATQTANDTPAPVNVDPSNSVKGSINGSLASFNSGLPKPYKGPTSNTSNLFQSILSGTSTPTQPSKPTSPFANVPTQPQSAAKALFSFSQPEAPKVMSPTKPVSPPTSDEVEEEDDADERESEDEDPADTEVEDQDLERQSGSGDDNGSDDEEDEEAPPSKPENLGKSLFDRIQPPSTASGDAAVTTPDGIQDKNTLKQPAPNHSFKPFTPFAPGVTKSTPQAPTVSPITPFAGSVKSKPMATFDFTPKVSVTTPTPIPGASIFAGGSIKSNGPIPGDGLFGSRPSTPNHDEPAPTNIFAGLTKTPHTTLDPSKDNTWSKGSPLKFDTPQKPTSGNFNFSASTNITTNFMTAFSKNAEEHEKADKAKRKYEDLGSEAEEDEIEEWEKEYEEKQQAKRAKTTANSGFGQGGFKPAVTQVDGQAEKQTTSAPSFSITAATPSKDNASSEKFSNLFGQTSDTTSPAPPATTPVGFSFGPAPASASALQPAASYLFPSANTSGLSSRATSPGATDNESVGTDGEADTTNDPQTSLMSDRPGEENEEVLYEARTKALKFMDKAAAAKQKGTTPDAYNSVGLGILRVLKNAETAKSRIVIRAEPGANVLLNTHLAPFINYSDDSRAAGSGVVRFGVPVENGKIEQWVLKVKNAGKAAELAKILTNNKSSTST